MADEHTVAPEAAAPPPAPQPPGAAPAGDDGPQATVGLGGEVAIPNAPRPTPPNPGPDEPGPPETPADPVTSRDELSARAAERDEYLALAQRTRADFENYRKRVARDAGAAETRGVTRLVRELLPAIDNLERALAVRTPGNPVGAGDQLLDGMRLVREDLRGALARVGVESFDPQGERFDPELHEAIAQHEVAGAAPGTVVEVYQAGYRLNASMIRPARVVVAGAPAGDTGPAETSRGGETA